MCPATTGFAAKISKRCSLRNHLRCPRALPVQNPVDDCGWRSARSPVLAQAPHLRCRAPPCGPGEASAAPRGPWPAADTQSRAGEVAGHCRTPARIEAKRTRQRRAWSGRKLSCFGVAMRRARARSMSASAPLPRHSASYARWVRISNSVTTFESASGRTVIQKSDVTIL
jgi:hypothetical protein